MLAYGLLPFTGYLSLVFIILCWTALLQNSVVILHSQKLRSISSDLYLTERTNWIVDKFRFK